MEAVTASSLSVLDAGDVIDEPEKVTISMADSLDVPGTGVDSETKQSSIDRLSIMTPVSLRTVSSDTNPHKHHSSGLYIG